MVKKKMKMNENKKKKNNAKNNVIVAGKSTCNSYKLNNMMLSCAKRIMQIMTMCACIFFVVKSSVPTLNEIYIYPMYCMWSSGM